VNAWLEKPDAVTPVPADDTSPSDRPRPQPADAAPVTTDEVGLIVVHGIGEQELGDHLEGVVKPLVEALNTDGRRVEVRLLAPVTRAGKRAEIAVREVTQGQPASKLTRIGVHEVHWADINEPASVGKGIRFWLWGLSAWCAIERKTIGSPEFAKRMGLPCFKPGEIARLRPATRLQLFVVAWIFLLAAPVIVAADYLAKKLFGTRLPASLTTIVNYVSAVKLYSQARRHGAGMLATAAEQPRFTIRRRMIEAVAEVAASRYDRWYVFAHSQGTVVAFNGLMTDGDIMANYLDDAALDRLGDGVVRDLPPDEAAELAADGRLVPPVPPGRLHRPRTIDRRALFGEFRGLLTYGSPLDKFAGIWPPTVAMAKDAAVFPPGARWLNVWDPTDPVSANLDAFDPHCVLSAGQDKTGCLKPENHPVAGGPVLLASHLGYLAGGTGSPKPLTALLGNWLLDDAASPNLTPLAIRRVRPRQWGARLQVVLLLGLLLWAWMQVSSVVPLLAGQLPSWASDWLATPLARAKGWLDGLLSGGLGLTGVVASLAEAVLVSVGLVVVLGLIGMLTTELDPADARRRQGRPAIYILNRLAAWLKH
jgi:hypothetical protein